METVTWSPWHGCHKCSPGCQNCFVYEMDKRYGRDTSKVGKAKTVFDVPIKKRYGQYKYPSGTTFKTCFTSDFFIEEADELRDEAWKMIRMRPDCDFVIATKRIGRMMECLPEDWGDGYDNVTIAVSCENQEMADIRIPYFLSVPIKHRYLFLTPLLEYVDIKKYLSTGDIEWVGAGGECASNSRVCSLAWVENIYLDCKEYDVPFQFHQTGSRLIVGTECKSISSKNQYIEALNYNNLIIEKYS